MAGWDSTPADGNGWDAPDAGGGGGGGGGGNGWDAAETGEGGQEAHERPYQPPFKRLDGPIQPWVEKKSYDYEALESGTTGDWNSNAKIYEWDGDEGEVGPEHPELEVMLFGNPEDRNPQGLDFSKIAQINVIQESEDRIEPINAFETAGLHPAMLKNVFLSGYKTPTPIQRYCVPAIKMGRDVIAIAQTGSGKTAAYLIPILSNLMGKSKKLCAPRPSPRELAEGTASPVVGEPLVVVVVPSRELACQIFDETRKFAYRSKLRPCAAYGGAPIRQQVEQITKGCDVLVATPGRLIDFMERGNVLSMRRVKYMVIDEADEMLHQDWEEEFGKIMSGGEQEEGDVKYMLFSATFPVAVRQLAKTHLAEDHIRIRVGRIGSTHENITQDIVWVDPFQKKRALLDLLYSREPGRTIIFVNSKRAADEIDDYLFNNDMPCTSMHSDRTQREREDSMRAFRSGTCPIMVTTGVTARGIDVRNVRHVINYDLPNMDHGGIEEYTHRIGRTGRIGNTGTATSFFTERDEALGPLLTLTLMETKQAIPDFLQQYKPEGDQLHKFEPDSDEYQEELAHTGHDEDNADGDKDFWGAGSQQGSQKDHGGDGWGAAGNTTNDHDGNGSQHGSHKGHGDDGWDAAPAASSVNW